MTEGWHPIDCNLCCVLGSGINESHLCQVTECAVSLGSHSRDVHQHSPPQDTTEYICPTPTLPVPRPPPRVEGRMQSFPANTIQSLFLAEGYSSCSTGSGRGSSAESGTPGSREWEPRTHPEQARKWHLSQRPKSPWCIPHWPTGVHLQNTNSKKLLRILRQRSQNIKLQKQGPSGHEAPSDCTGQIPLKLDLPTKDLFLENK